MNFRQKRSEEPEINLIPLIDVLLMTLIFLLVATSFSRETQLRLRLPEAAAEARSAQSNVLEVGITAQGQYVVRGPDEKQGQAVLNPELDSLQRALRAAAGGKTDLVVVIRADRKTPHESVIRAMDGARRLGFVNITFATQQPSAAGQP